MSELKQRLLLQELAKIGYTEAHYISDSDKIKIQPNNDRMPFIDNEGSVFYGSELQKLVESTILPLVTNVNEVINAWEKAQPMPIDGVSNFRPLAEYNNIVLCARDDTEKGYGFHFVTWEYNQKHTAVEHGHYTADYGNAKEDFAKRAGLIQDDKIFTPEQAAEVIKTVDYRVANDEYITLETENNLKDISAKLKDAYPETKSILEKTAPDKGAPISENTAIEEQTKTLYQQFADKIDAEMRNYTDYIMDKDKREIFGMATDIAMKQEIVWSIKNNDYKFDDDDIEYLLSHDNLLTELAGELKGYVLDRLATNDDVKDTIINVLSQRFESGDYSLENYGVTVEGHTDTNVKPDKYSILGDLKEKSKEVKPPDKQQKKDDIDLS